MSHLTTGECKAIDNGTFSDSKIPQFCKSWVDIQELFQFAIQQILNYLKSEDEDFKHMELNQHMEFMRKVTTATKHTDIDIYTNTITKYLVLEQFSLKDIIAYEIDNLKDHLTSPKKNSLKIRFEFDFKTIIELFDFEDFEKHNKIFKKATGDYFDTEIGTNSVTAMLEEIKPQNRNSLFVTYKIKSNSEDVDLIDYENIIENDKAQTLWNHLKKRLQEANPESKIILTQWYVE